ncbi:MAG: YafY family transcriptional regulator [Myxococcales bacterium]|nr:YafY family transcriptional regulator [Myxococcales bacterium]MCB9644943.1 YafY family transcriptional regulator [Myxococcales bacterium]
MRRADRLFELVQLMRKKRVVTAQELAEKMEVSVRTVYRDIRDLQISGVPIDGEAGVGYSLQRGYELPPLTFNTEELEALVLGARMVTAWGDRGLGAAARRILTKVESVLPEGLRSVMEATQLYAPPMTSPQSPHLEAVRRALSDRRKLEFGYTRQDGLVSKRTVCPLALYFWGRTWLLASWCELREDYRNFRVDRMVDVHVCDESFEESEEISFDRYVEMMRASDCD